MYRFLQESPTICSTNHFCNQQWQDTLAPCYCSMHSQSCLLHHLSCWWSWVQMSTRPHSWMSPRCCQAWHIHQDWSGWTTRHHSLNLRSWSVRIHSANTCWSCSTTICCPCNTQASYSLKPYISNPHPVEDTCKVLQMYNHRMGELLSHLANLVVSLRYHNILLNRCKYNCDNVTG